MCNSKSNNSRNRTLILSPKVYLTLVLTFSYALTFAQCEGLKGNKEGMKNWKQKYMEFWEIDSSFQFIAADSVLIYYITNEDNETNSSGISCCYYLADKFAQTELTDILKSLYSNLEKEDSLNFQKAQQAWQTYYENEWEFLRQAFVGYANLSKYGLGREAMIETVSRKYQIIKDRILMVESYIETASGKN